MALGKGIPVINSFDLNSKLPLDSRAVADTMEEMNALTTNGSVGDGQLCYCKADKKLYVLKDNVWSEVGGSGGGGNSVPPTLLLIDMETEDVRTSITQEEKDNLEKGLYNQVLYPDGTAFGYYMPSKMLGDKLLDINTFAQFYLDMNAQSITSLALYGFSIGEKDTSGNYPITIEKQIDIPIGSGGSASIPTLPTKAPSIYNVNDTTYTDADIELIKKQENNFIIFPVGDDTRTLNTLCFVAKSGSNGYILYAVGGTGLVTHAILNNAPTSLYWGVDVSTKKITTESLIGLSHDETSLYVRDGKIFLTDTLTTQDPVNVLHNSYTFDTINGKPIIHSDTAVNSYNIPTITFED